MRRGSTGRSRRRERRSSETGAHGGSQHHPDGIILGARFAAGVPESRLRERPQRRAIPGSDARDDRACRLLMERLAGEPQDLDAEAAAAPFGGDAQIDLGVAIRADIEPRLPDG